jgi:CheY-like chemotaxis protein
MAQIVWIEDDHERIGSLVKLLQRDGHTIVPFSSWQETSEQIKALSKCDAVILDIILPNGRKDPYFGVSVLERLRKEYAYEKPIIVCSRVKNPVVLSTLNELGVTAILRKPVRPSILYDVVTNALESGG